MHLVIDPLYEIHDAELRLREFVPVFRDFFTQLGLDRVIDGAIAEHRLLGQHVDKCVVREAAREKAESAELFVRNTKSAEGTKRTLVIQVCPQSLIDPRRFIFLMRRELMHIADMLDERFAYRRDNFAGPLSLQNLQRDRYRVLWDTYVEGRLHRGGPGTNEEMTHLERAFVRVFANVGAVADVNAFRRVFDASSLTHRQLMDWAGEPNLLFQPVSEAEEAGRFPSETGQSLTSSDTAGLSHGPRRTVSDGSLTPSVGQLEGRRLRPND